MGQPGAKKNDQIVSAGDVHIIMVPSPGGPVPTPIPHPCTSTINDKLADKVKVMGLPGAVKGSISKHTPPHVPMGPGPFQKPPANKGEIVTASSNVLYEGKGAAMLGDTGKMCADPTDSPVGKVMGTAATVMIGGGGQGSDAARAAALDKAMAAAGAVCHMWINDHMPPGADREKAHRDVCTATGHPIDVATGKMFTRTVELKLRGRLPFEFVRNYSSARPDLGPMGRGWRHTLETRLFVHPEFVAHRDGNGRYLPFEPVAIGHSSRNELARATLTRNASGYVMETADGQRQTFDPSAGPTLAAPGGAVAIPLTSLADQFGNALRFESRPDGLLAKVIDTAGRIVFFDYDERGFLTTLSLSQGRPGDTPAIVRRYTYENDLLVRAADATGAAAEYEYAGHSMLVRETDRCGLSFYFTYDRDGWCRETWGDGGLLYRRMEYDVARRRTRVVDSFGRTTVYDWTADGVVTRATDADGNAWDFVYNDSLQQISARDPLGNMWSYEYDPAGRLLASTDPEGNASKYAYDARGRMAVYVDRNGNQWTWTYAPDGRGIRMGGPMGYQTATEKNARGEVTRVLNRHGDPTTLEYSERGDLVRYVDPAGLDVRRTHALGGELLTESDQFGRRLELTYDALGNVKTKWQRDKGRQTYERDAEGRVTAVIDDAGRRHDYVWCNLLKVKRVTFPEVTLANGMSTRPVKEFDYDNESRLVAVRLPGGEAVRYDYDGTHLERPTRVTYPDGRVQEVGRNAAGFVTSLTESGQLVFRQDVDSSGHVTRRVTGDDEVITFEHDGLGRLTVAEAEECSLEVTRDALGRVVVEAWDHAEIAFAYDEPDAMRRITVSEDFELTLNPAGPGAGGRGGVALRVTAAGRAAAGMYYDELNRLASFSFFNRRRPDGTLDWSRVEQRFGNSGLPSERLLTGPNGAPVRTDRYDYDDDGLLRAARRSDGRTDGHDDVRFARGVTYVRDALGRLAEEVVESRPADAADRPGVRRRATWQYDAAGNRARATRAAGDGTSNTAATAAVADDRRFLTGNRLAVAAGVKLTYDGRGRVILREDGRGEITRFRGDALNRLREVTAPDGETLRMTYDPMGRRVAVEGPQGTTRFVYNGRNVVHEHRPDGSQRHFFYETGSYRPILCFERAADADAEAWDVSAYATDPRGCPDAVLSADGTLAWQADVQPWGVRENETSTGAAADAARQPLGLPGQYVDVPGRLSFNNARYYMPDLGAFLSPDPIGLDGGDLAYAYCDDPICWVDPLGLAKDDYDPLIADILFGPVQAPWETREGELDLDADIRAVTPDSPLALGGPDETDRYLYAVTEDGTLLYAPQSAQEYGDWETVKHTTLAGRDPNNPGEARPMRVAGEIKYNPRTGQWVMDGASGRYSWDRATEQETRTTEHVENAAQLANKVPGGTPVVASPVVFPPRR